MSHVMQTTAMEEVCWCLRRWLKSLVITSREEYLKYQAEQYGILFERC